MKKYFIKFFVFLIFFFFGFSNLIIPIHINFAYADNNEIEISSILSSLDAKNAVLGNADTGEIILNKDMNARIFPASTTKILTAMVANEHLKPDEIITVGNEISNIPRDASIAGLSQGMQIKALDLIRGLMLPSGNDAAYALAVYVGRKVTNNPELSIQDSVSIFVDLMNKKARSIGAVDSNFANPDGYHMDNHFVTAHDMFLIGSEYLKNESLRSISMTLEASLENINNSLTRPITWINKNNLINPNTSFYNQFATGIKTGYTSEAGYCLVSSATKGDINFIAVAMNCSNDAARFNDSNTLLNYAIQNYMMRKLYSKDDVLCKLKVKKGFLIQPIDLDIKAPEDKSIMMHKNNINRINTELEINPSLVDPSNKNLLEAPISKDQVLGKINYLVDGKIIHSIEIKSGKNIKVDNTNFYIIIGASLIIITIIILLVIGTNRNKPSNEYYDPRYKYYR